MKPTAALADNPVLFGHDARAGIIAAELVPGDDSAVRVFLREGGKLKSVAQPFEPFLWLADAALLNMWPGKAHIEQLKGGGELRYLTTFRSWADFQSARKYLAEETNATPASPDAPFYWLNDPIAQHLMQTGQTSFKGLKFEDLSRLQLDIETYTGKGYEFSSAERAEDRIILIALADSTGWEKTLAGDEEEMLRQLVEIVRERDPDVIEGHNLFKFDLPYIEARAKRHKAKLALGRDGSAPGSYPSRVQVAERTINYPKYEIFGRHIVDTYLLAQFYDVSTRELESFGLKDVAQHFGLAPKDRTYLEPSEIPKLADGGAAGLEKLARYALDDVRETRALAALLSPSYFVQAQMFPYAYQDIVVRGNATKIDALFVREYLHQRHALPRPEPARPYEGGYTDIFHEGVAQNVWHCDVASLYPSVILAFDITPKKDELGIYRSLLSDLREFRLRAKAALRDAAHDAARSHLNALQQTFKIVLNSFYGYLGFAQAHFGDFDAASAVTANGRETLQAMIAWLRQRGAHIIEIDTDGIYFQPPQDVANDPKRGLLQLDDELTKTLPKGIDVEFDACYRAMFSYKMKNYALLDHEGHMTIKGAALKSRGLERFQREFMEDMLRLLLEGRRRKDVLDKLEEYRAALEQHRWPVEMFMKTETLADSLDVYKKKITAGSGKGGRNRSAAYEVALRSGRAYQPGDQVSFYITGDTAKVTAYEACKPAGEWDPQRRDENVEYYVDKLVALYKKFAGLIPP
ncbi:MAG: DNA polymerase II [Verrucomicrobia bacterium]|nr:DNA polymerase II [Verrucomicrobiota bacterium]